MVPPKGPKVEPSLDDSLIITILLLLTDLDTFSQTAGMLIPPNYIIGKPITTSFPFREAKVTNRNFTFTGLSFWEIVILGFL